MPTNEVSHIQLNTEISPGRAAYTSSALTMLEISPRRAAHISSMLIMVEISPTGGGEEESPVVSVSRYGPRIQVM